MIRKTSTLIATLAAALLLTGVPARLRAEDGKGGGNNNSGNNGNMQTETRLKTTLAGAAIQGQKPEGNADFRNDAKGRTRLNVEVEHVNLPSGAVLSVFAMQGTTTAVQIGTITLNAAGHGDLELETEDGATVPAVVAGQTMIIVKNAAAIILSGAF